MAFLTGKVLHDCDSAGETSATYGIMMPSSRRESSRENQSRWSTDLSGWVRDKVAAIFSHRWLATIMLILVFDIATFFAFSKTGGASLSFPHQDKALHALTFMVLTVLGHLSLNFDFFRRTHKFSFLLFALNAFGWGCYGVLTELGQKMLGYRQASMGDLIADFVGIGLGSLWVIGMKLYPQEGSGNYGKEGR